jgi:hypothetical protein
MTHIYSNLLKLVWFIKLLGVTGWLVTQHIAGVRTNNNSSYLEYMILTYLVLSHAYQSMGYGKQISTSYESLLWGSLINWDHYPLKVACPANWSKDVVHDWHPN